MDDRLRKALDMSNYIATLNKQKESIQKKYKDKLAHYYNGAKFTISLELISYLYNLSSNGETTAYLVDDNDIPVEIDNIGEFADTLQEKYTQATKDFFDAYEELKSQRSTETLIQYEQ